MCAVAGHVDNSSVVSSACDSPSDAATRITSGRWQEAFTIVSNVVRATATRNPRCSSWRVRRDRDAGSASAISASGSAIDAVADGRGKFSDVIVCNSDIDGPPSEFAPVCEQKLCRGSGAQEPVDGDRRERAGDNRDSVQVGCLMKRIEHRENQEAGQSARDRAGEDFGDDKTSAVRTAVSFCKVALAVRTGRHLVGISAGGPHLSTGP